MVLKRKLHQKLFIALHLQPQIFCKMSLEQQITDDMKVAMRNKDKVALEAIRAIKGAIIIAKTEAGAKETMSPEEEIQLLSRLKKQRVDSATIFREQNRADLAEPEEAQIAIIENYLPAQLSEAEIKKTIADIITQTGASGMKDMGKVMGMANGKMAGKADGKTISSIVKEMLA